MQRCGHRGALLGVLWAIGLGVSLVWAQTAPPPAPVKAKLERLKIAVAPLGWDTNFTWLNPRSGNLDKRPALEFLVGIDRRTGAYIPELAEQWEMAPDSKSWTITLRKGVKFHDNWGEFTAKDVRHAIFLITQPEAVQTDSGQWRTLLGIEKADTSDTVAQKVAQMVQIVHDYQVIIHTKIAALDLVDKLSANTDLGMEIVSSTLSANQVVWYFGGLYFASLDKLDSKVPFVDKRVRQAMNMAINRHAIADTLLLGMAQPARVATYHPELDSKLWPGIWNADWDKRFEELYGYNPTKAKALLDQAGYPHGFEFTVYLFPLPGLPEQVDIGQAMALDWQAVGLKPKLVEIDFPRVRELYRTKAIHGAVWGLRGRALAPDAIRIINKSQDGVIYAYEHPFIDARLKELGRVLDPGERARLLREIGDHKFTEFAEMPLFWLCAEVAVNPRVIAEYVFPGSIPGFYTHLEYIKLAP